MKIYLIERGGGSGGGGGTKLNNFKGINWQCPGVSWRVLEIRFSFMTFKV